MSTVLASGDGMNNDADELIKALASDTRSGAAEILRRAVDVFPRLCATGDLNVDAGVVREACRALARAQPQMAPLINLANAALIASRGGSPIESALEAARRFLGTALAATDALAGHAAALIPDGAGVLTHSRSSTVEKALTLACERGTTFTLFATEGRPGFEGRTLAGALAARGVPVHLFVDAAAGTIMERVSVVMVGADRVSPGVIVNKVGTRMLILAARERGLPIYALCDTTKFIASQLTTEPERDTREVWEIPPRGVTVNNRYFEEIPLDLLTGVVTEHGMMSPEEASRAAGEAQVELLILDAARGGESIS